MELDILLRIVFSSCFSCDGVKIKSNPTVSYQLELVLEWSVELRLSSVWTILESVNTVSDITW